MLEIIPAVDVLDGNVVRLMHGDYDRVTVYSDDPVGQCREWMDQGAGLVHVVDLSGAKSGEPDGLLWNRLADADISFQVGGGIRTAATADRALAAGARRVVMGTAAVWDPGVLGAVSEPARVVAAIDVRDGRATGAGWLDDGRDLADVLDDLEQVGVSRLLVTGIERDGTMQGPATALLERAMAGDRFLIIASGGVGRLEDLQAIDDLGCESVIVGRALYEDRFSVSEAISFLSGLTAT